jgi:hypothetical protein
MSIRPVHRVRRFFSSIVPGRPSDQDLAWAGTFLSDDERRLFSKMTASDQRHLVGVAKAVERHGIGGQPPEQWVMAAALLHDVGKTVAGLGTYGRVVATLSEAVGGATMATAWTESSGFTRKVGLYLQYPGLGADLLQLAGSDERVVAWAAEHHLPEAAWTVPVAEGRVLSLADDGRL